MGRFFVYLVLAALLLVAPVCAQEDVQPVFFSLMFPRLMPQSALERTPGEAVAL